MRMTDSMQKIFSSNILIKKNNAGLDFQKAVIIIDESYINTSARPEVRNIDYMAIHFKDYEIKRIAR